MANSGHTLMASVCVGARVCARVCVCGGACEAVEIREAFPTSILDFKRKGHKGPCKTNMGNNKTKTIKKLLMVLSHGHTLCVSVCYYLSTKFFLYF